ncbi:MULTISPECIES: hypothetical protein [Streptomyces]|uniref:Transmembrane protein n=1 Tax=Streptomyces koyangensis TaxID=188770 RepID=A0A385DEI1_9ACTN|nr:MULTISPECIES: hypothetical protein [Streptomyces]AXQ56087.1 hypothetical protein D0C37_16685 [Streptomyces koyangensis]PKR45585.1 hypothetical protein CWE27_08530 [Streptomyces sp. EAG2]
MHMNSAPHLLNEDRAAYERLLDEALRTITHDDGHHRAALPGRLPVAELRRLALGDAAAITAAAATEYRHLLSLREELGEATAAGPATDDDPATAPGGSGLTTAVSQMTEATGAGALAVLAVLAPLLAGTAALIFLLVGYGLRMLDPAPALAQTLLTTGWVFAAFAAAALLAAGLALLLTALRNKALFPAAPVPADPLRREVRQAADAWERALTERGILPFLRTTLAEAAASGPEPRPGREAVPADPTHSAEADRMPQLGYGRPGFSSPAESGQDRPDSRPSYQSPQFSSPDFSGPEYDGPGHG